MSLSSTHIKLFASLASLATLASLFWGATGAVIIGSIYHSFDGLVVNLVVGSLFVLFGVFYFFKERRFYQFVLRATSVEHELKQAVLRDKLFSILLVGLLGAIALSAVVSRVFGEHYAVFG